MIFHNHNCSFCKCLDMRRFLSHPSEGMEFRHQIVLLREKFVNGEEVPANRFRPEEKDYSLPFDILTTGSIGYLSTTIPKKARSFWKCRTITLSR